jgi:opacity protein-like surface antigen
VRHRLFGIGPLTMLGILITAPAHAEGFISPYIGNNFSGDAGQCTTVAACSSKHLTYGVSAGFMGGGIVGFEEDVSYAPNFFGSVPAFGNNSVLTAMTNLIVGAPLGPIHPYVSGGAGVIRTSVNFAPAGLATVDDTSLGYDIGGGLMAYFAPNVGIRADYRYIRGAKDITIGNFSISNTALRFQRATVGLAIRF